MKRLLALALLLCFGPAQAQNITCATRPASDTSNACASTKFVATAVAGGSSSLVVGTSPITGGTNTDVLNITSGKLGSYTASAAATVASSVVLRDANANAFANNFVDLSVNNTLVGGTVVMTAASSRHQTMSGSVATTFQLPVATTLISGTTYQFDNNASAAVTVKDNGSNTIYTVPAGGNVVIDVTDVSTANGAWDSHPIPPSSVTWGSAVGPQLPNGTGLPISTGLTGAGTGVLTALGVNVGTAGAFVVNGGALGTPSSGTLTNTTGLPTSALTGTLAAAQEPAHTGGVTNSAGSLALTVITNANLTGDVTSVGNATTLAAGNAGNLNSGTLLAARMPALTGDCTSTVGTIATTCAKTSLPYFSASLSAAQTVSTGVITKMQANTVLVDSNSWYDGVTNFRYTPLQAGKYRMSGSCEGLGTTISEVDSELRKNGSTYARNLNLASGVATSSTIDITMTANGSTDFFELFCIVTGTGTTQINGGTAPIRSWFEGRYIGQ